jgi:hypothetical protein
MSDQQPTAGGGAQPSYSTVVGGAKTAIRTDETGAITSPPGGQNPIAQATRRRPPLWSARP